MSALKTRLPKMLIVIGVTLLLVSLFTNFSSTTLSFRYTSSHEIETDGFVGYVFEAQNNIFVSARERYGQRFSLYIFDHNATTSAIELQSLENVTTLFMIENITSFEEIVTIPGYGIYSMYVVPTDTLPIIVRATITAIGLQTTMTVLGVAVMGIGVLIITVREIFPILFDKPEEDGAPAGT
ncbi:MAG: hypothetical protein RTU30_08680 [Candidatus Thorarchaeota archaeon]